MAGFIAAAFLLASFLALASVNQAQAETAEEINTSVKVALERFKKQVGAARHF